MVKMGLIIRIIITLVPQSMLKYDYRIRGNRGTIHFLGFAAHVSICRNKMLGGAGH